MKQVAQWTRMGHPILPGQFNSGMRAISRSIEMSVAEARSRLLKIILVLTALLDDMVKKGEIPVTKPFSDWTEALKEHTKYFHHEGQFMELLEPEWFLGDGSMGWGMKPTGETSHSEASSSKMTNWDLLQAIGFEKSPGITITDPDKVRKVMAWLYANAGAKMPERDPEAPKGDGIFVPPRPLVPKEVWGRLHEAMKNMSRDMLRRRLELISSELATKPWVPGMEFNLRASLEAHAQAEAAAEASRHRT